MKVTPQMELTDKCVATDFTHSMWGDVVSWAIYNRPTALSILFHPVDEEQVRSTAQIVIAHLPYRLPLEVLVNHTADFHNLLLGDH